MDKALQTMINNMPEKTGKSLEQWKKILKAKAFAKHSEGVKFLKTEHGVTHGFANTIVTLSKDESTSDEDLVANQYKGKEALLPIYESLLTKEDFSKHHQKETICLNQPSYKNSHRSRPKNQRQTDRWKARRFWSIWYDVYT